MDLFEMVRRKKKDRSTVEFVSAEALPRDANSEPTYLARETLEFEQLGNLISHIDLFNGGDTGDDQTGLANKAV